jgi:hypothetical protein
MLNTMGLSKSKYCKGIQCPKILWLDIHKPQEAGDVQPESVMTNGDRVGELARDYFGDYRLVAYSCDKQVMVQQTKNMNRFHSSTHYILSMKMEHWNIVSF